MAEEPRTEPIVKHRPKLESAAIAGILYALTAIAALLLFRTVPIEATADEWDAWIRDGANRRNLNLGFYAASISAVGYFWFVAVIRRRLGPREDKFFATVFLGSALVYAGLWLVAAATLAAPATLHHFAGGTFLSWDAYQLAEGTAGGLLLTAGPRIEAVFVASTSVISLRTRILPAWLGYLGLLLAIAMFVIPIVATPVGLLLPGFVFVVSIALLVIRRHDALAG